MVNTNKITGSAGAVGNRVTKIATGAVRNPAELGRVLQIKGGNNWHRLVLLDRQMITGLLGNKAEEIFRRINAVASNNDGLLLVGVTQMKQGAARFKVNLLLQQLRTMRFQVALPGFEIIQELLAANRIVQRNKWDGEELNRLVQERDKGNADEIATLRASILDQGRLLAIVGDLTGLGAHRAYVLAGIDFALTGGGSFFVTQSLQANPATTTYATKSGVRTDFGDLSPTEAAIALVIN